MALPLLVEPAALAKGRRERHQPAAADGQHRSDTAIQRVGNAGGLVKHQQADAAEGSNGLLAPRQAQDAGAVGQFQACLRLVNGRQQLIQGVIASEHFAIDFATLPQRRRHKQHQRSWPEQGRVQRQGGDHGGFATLPRAVEQQLSIARQ